MGAVPVGAEAFPVNCSPLEADPTAVYEYHLEGDGWDDTDATGVSFEDQVRAPLADWESVRGLTGAPLVDIQETEQDGVEIIIGEIEDHPPGEPIRPSGRLAQVDCEADRVIVNRYALDGVAAESPFNPPDDYYDFPGLMGPALRHEFGHMMGLNHSGFSDSLLDARHPAMGSCYTQIPPVGTWDLRDSEVSHDDAAALHQRLSPPGWENVVGRHAWWLAVNPGFEAPVAAAGWNGLSVSYGIGSTNSHQGQRHLEVTPSGSGEVHKLYQWASVAFAEQDSDSIESVYLSAFAFARSLGGSQEVALHVLVKPVVYSANEASCHDNTTRTFQNVRLSVGPAMQVSDGSFTVGSAWTSWGTAPGSIDNSAGKGAYDVAFVVMPEHGGPGIALDDAGTRIASDWAL